MKVKEIRFGVENSNITCNLVLETPYLNFLMINGKALSSIHDRLKEYGIPSNVIENRGYNRYNSLITVRIPTNAIKLIDAINNMGIILNKSDIDIIISSGRCYKRITKHIDDNLDIDISDLDIPENIKKAIQYKVNTVYGNLNDYYNMLEFMS